MSSCWNKQRGNGIALSSLPALPDIVSGRYVLCGDLGNSFIAFCGSLVALLAVDLSTVHLDQRTCWEPDATTVTGVAVKDVQQRYLDAPVRHESASRRLLLGRQQALPASLPSSASLRTDSRHKRAVLSRRKTPVIAVYEQPLSGMSDMYRTKIKPSAPANAPSYY